MILHTDIRNMCQIQGKLVKLIKNCVHTKQIFSTSQEEKSEFGFNFWLHDCEQKLN